MRKDADENILGESYCLHHAVTWQSAFFEKRTGLPRYENDGFA